MSTCLCASQNAQAPHEHGPGCGHTAIRHDGHVDYLQNS